MLFKQLNGNLIHTMEEQLMLSCFLGEQNDLQKTEIETTVTNLVSMLVIY